MGAVRSRVATWWRRLLVSDYGITTLAGGVAVVASVTVADRVPADAVFVVSMLTLATVLLPVWSGLTWWRFHHAGPREWATVARRAERPAGTSRWYWWTMGRGTVQSISWVANAGTFGVAAGAVVLPTASLISPSAATLLVVLSVTTVVASWLSVNVAYAVHYATCYHRRDDGVAGLEFPGTDEPTLPDFAYLSFAVGTTVGTTDVVVTSTAMRRRVLVHSLLAFTYNTVLVALVLSVVVGLTA